MAYCEELAERVRGIMGGHDGYSERNMFGGVCCMINGNMACGVINDDLMLRISPETAEKLLKEPHVREMDFTGRPMKGMVYVGSEATESDEDLSYWVDIAIKFADSLPPKKLKKK